MPRVRTFAALAFASLLGLAPAARADEPSTDPFTRTGTFRALVADEFAAGKSSLLYELETDDGEILPLRFALPRPPEPETESP
jgi:hypothetical protein